MERREIKIYIFKHRKDYSRENIVQHLVNYGAIQSEVESIYDEIESYSSLNQNGEVKKSKSGLGLTLILIGFFIPLIGIILIIMGIVYGFKGRKINSNDGLALTNIILGFVLLFFHVFLVIPVVVIFGFQMWFMTYQSGINAKVEQQSYSSVSFTVQRLEANPNSEGAVVYVMNSGIESTIVSVRIPEVPSCGVAEVVIAPSAVQNLIVPDCAVGNIISSQRYDVVLVAPSGVFTSTQLAR